jgi:hypothetical protein
MPKSITKYNHLHNKINFLVKDLIENLKHFKKDSKFQTHLSLKCFRGLCFRRRKENGGSISKNLWQGAQLETKASKIADDRSV